MILYYSWDFISSGYNVGRYLIPIHFEVNKDDIIRIRLANISETADRQLFHNDDIPLVRERERERERDSGRERKIVGEIMEERKR
jgi:hypothetical protein